MRKIDQNIENPFDNIFIGIFEDMSDFYKKLNFTPNMLTTLSLFFGLASCYLLYKGNNTLAMIFWIIAYFYDCADGYFARKYKMTSKFGDVYDHISDATKMILLLFVMYNVNKNKLKTTLPIIIAFSMLSFVHLGCQEKIYNNDDESVTINKLKILCPNAKYIKFTKYFGTGTLMMVVAYLIYNYK
jgi:phosphatidylglycerophosphate synthase